MALYGPGYIYTYYDYAASPNDGRLKRNANPTYLRYELGDLFIGRDFVDGEGQKSIIDTQSQAAAEWMIEYQKNREKPLYDVLELNSESNIECLSNDLQKIFFTARKENGKIFVREIEKIMQLIEKFFIEYYQAQFLNTNGEQLPKTKAQRKNYLALLKTPIQLWDDFIKDTKQNGTNNELYKMYQELCENDQYFADDIKYILKTMKHYTPNVSKPVTQKSIRGGLSAAKGEAFEIAYKYISNRCEELIIQGIEGEYIVKGKSSTYSTSKWDKQNHDSFKKEYQEEMSDFLEQLTLLGAKYKLNTTIPKGDNIYNITIDPNIQNLVAEYGISLKASFSNNELNNLTRAEFEEKLKKQLEDIEEEKREEVEKQIRLAWSRSAAIHIHSGSILGNLYKLNGYDVDGNVVQAGASVSKALETIFVNVAGEIDGWEWSTILDSYNTVINRFIGVWLTGGSIVKGHADFFGVYKGGHFYLIPMSKILEYAKDKSIIPRIERRKPFLTLEELKEIDDEKYNKKGTYDVNKWRNKIIKEIDSKISLEIGDYRTLFGDLGFNI